MKILKNIAMFLVVMLWIISMSSQAYADEIKIYLHNDPEVEELVNKCTGMRIEDMKELDAAFMDSDFADDFHVYYNGKETKSFSLDFPGHFIHVSADTSQKPTITFVSDKNIKCINISSDETFLADNHLVTSPLTYDDGITSKETYGFF